MMPETGLIFDIQSYSIHDGPGCRTTVFMSGCRLSCQWCANPESWQAQEKVLFSETRCRATQGCSRCVDRCSEQAISITQHSLRLDRMRCLNCQDLACTKVCPPQALKRCGDRYSVEALITRLQHDQDFWSHGGGVTFSGGDPFVQHRFLENITTRCHDAGIHTAVETTAYVREDIFLNIMQNVDFAFIDIKHMNGQVHRQYTGVGNTLILNNITSLIKSDWPGRLVLRVPVIAGFNDSDENMQDLAEFMEHAGVYEVNLLPFHRMGESKWEQLGKTYPAKDWKPPTETRFLELESFFTRKKLVCYLGSDTSF